MVPPGGFSYTEPESGVRFRHIVFADLLEKVRLHRIANGYPLPPGWEETVEDEACATQPTNIWRYVDGEQTQAEPPRRLHISDVKNFARVVGAWMGTGAEYVETQEAERRADICMACPKNQPIEGCTPCAQLIETISKAVAGRSTSKDAGLQGCAVCSCSNRVQVHIPLEVLQRGVTDEMIFPAWCWKKPL